MWHSQAWYACIRVCFVGVWMCLQWRCVWLCACVAVHACVQCSAVAPPCVMRTSILLHCSPWPFQRDEHISSTHSSASNHLLVGFCSWHRKHFVASRMAPHSSRVSCWLQLSPLPPSSGTVDGRELHVGGRCFGCCRRSCCSCSGRFTAPRHEPRRVAHQHYLRCHQIGATTGVASRVDPRVA